jgi:hypothetical protein
VLWTKSSTLNSRVSERSNRRPDPFRALSLRCRTPRNRWGVRGVLPPVKGAARRLPSTEVSGMPSARELGRAQVVLCRVPLGSSSSASACADTYGSSGNEPLPVHRRRLRRGNGLWNVRQGPRGSTRSARRGLRVRAGPSRHPSGAARCPIRCPSGGTGAIRRGSHGTKPARLQGFCRCRRRDSNPRHADYDSAALTD